MRELKPPGSAPPGMPAGTPPVQSASATAITLDVEDWFHVPGHPLCREPGRWGAIPSRFEQQVQGALNFLGSTGSRATCFVLGWLAQRYPSLVRDIAAQGHEVASHGMSHELVFEMGPERFREDAGRAKALLEDLLGLPVPGYRAPRWSLSGAPWAYEVLAGLGCSYSSSLLPIPGLGGGRPDLRERSGVLEIPALASPPLPWRVPAGGTLALRLLPVRLLARWRNLALGHGIPAVYWFHPWELDPRRQDLPGASAPFRFQRFGLLSRLPSRLETLAAGSRKTLGEIADQWRLERSEEVKNG